MTGGTLIITRAINHHQDYKEYLESFGFKGVMVTDIDKDGLYLLIREMKPNLVMIEACFYECATPYMTRELLDAFPELNIIAVNMYNYPDELAMWFIFYGCKSYLNLFEGRKEFKKGLKEVYEGKIYISPNVQERIELRNEIPDTSGRITARLIEIIRLICCGYNNFDIGELLQLTRKTVYTHRTNIYRMLNVTSATELIKAAFALNIIKPEEIYFYPKDFTTNPKPENMKYQKRDVTKLSREQLIINKKNSKENL